MPFSDERADRAVAFFEQFLVHGKGQWAGQPFRLLDWQRTLIRELFGRINEDGLRQYRQCYVEIPRKAGKSHLAAGIALYMLLADGEPGAEVYGAAGDREQAGIVFNVAAEMVSRSPELSRRCKVIDSRKRIVYQRAGSFYEAIPADEATSHGFNASCVVFDEVHVQPNRGLYDVLTTSMGARRQPLMFAITTAGYDRHSLCWQLHDYALKVRDGIIDDRRFLPVIYAADPEDDWTAPATWYRANPSLGETVSEDFLSDECRQAREMPAYENTFKRLYLNIWTEQAKRHISMDVWDEQAGNVDESSLLGRECYGGLDLSAVSDLTALALVFPHDDNPDELDIVMRFWCPEARLYDRHNRFAAQYRVWAQQGFLRTTPGDSIDYGFIKAEILGLAARFRLVDLNIDRLFQGWGLTTELAEEGLRVFPMGQGFLSMAMPMKEFDRRLLSRKLRHGGNPVLRWMAANFATKQDEAGNLKPDKATSESKIDGIVALVMAIDRAMRRETRASVYDERGLTVV